MHVETAVPGKWGYRCTGMSYINFPRMLLCTMNNGVDLTSNRRFTKGYGYFTEMESYEELLKAWDKTIREITRYSVIVENVIDKASERDVPDILCSALTDDCIARGKTIKEGGAVYDFISGLQVGIANMADCLAAIKKLVYEEKKITRQELWNAILDDFSSPKNKKIQEMLIREAPKYGNDDDITQTLTPVADTENSLFSFKTGMELVYMESTRYSGGLVYSILQDAGGKRYIYGINMSNNGFVQEAKYENLNAPDFDKATSFAFHSQFPYMFYAVGNKVYLHNLGTNTTYPVNNIALGENETVTMLKFNLYRQCSLKDLNNQSEEFMARQYELMVGSYNAATPDNNGGRLGFYPVDGVNNSVTKRIEYSGFAKIKDVVYRERR